MSEIRIKKIDGVEFVTYKDYLRLKEEKQQLEYLGDINEELKEENKKLQEKVTTYSEEYGKLREEKNKLKDELKERHKLIRDIVLNFHRINENKILELLLKIPTE